MFVFVLFYVRRHNKEQKCEGREVIKQGEVTFTPTTRGHKSRGEIQLLQFLTVLDKLSNTFPPLVPDASFSLFLRQPRKSTVNVCIMKGGEC